MELLKQTGWSRIRPSLYHYRTQAGVEVGFLLEAPGGPKVLPMPLLRHSR